MKKREARKILNARIYELAELAKAERLSQRAVNRVVVALREAGCAAMALKQRIDGEPPMTSDRMHDAE